MKKFKEFIREDAVIAGPTNVVGTGNIAGTGGKGGEPGVSPKTKKPVMSFLTRKKPND